MIEYAWTHTSTVTRIYLSRSLGLFFSSRRNRFYRIISCACHRVNKITCGRNNHKNSWRDTSYLGKISVISPKIFFISPRAQLELVYLADISFISVRSLLSRRDLCDILRFDEISLTLGTRGFSRVRREFSVLAEGRHIFGYRPKPRRLARNRKPR